jgi:hypothetical protein
MKYKNIYISSLIALLASLLSISTRNAVAQQFKPSYKQSINSNNESSFTEFLDSKTNTYSNFKYGFSIKFPKNWFMDKGASEHTIIRGGVLDSMITMAVNVIELNLNDGEGKITSIWPIYDNNRNDYELKMRANFRSVTNSNFNLFNTKKIYIFNNQAILTNLEYNIKQVDYEYIQKVIIYQLYKIPYMITVSLNIPKVVHELNPNHYNTLIDRFSLIMRKQ